MHTPLRVFLRAVLTLGIAASGGLAAAKAFAAANSALPQNAATAPAKQRVITLAPHITELIFAAGAGDRIVGTIDSSAYPAAAQSIPRIGDGVSVSVEKAVALKPNLVVAWMPSNATRLLMPTLTRLRVPLIYSNPQKIADIPAEIVKFGHLLGTPETALPAAAKLKRRLDALRAKYSGLRPVSVFIEVGTRPLYTIGSDPLINDALRVCGGVNIYARLNVAAPQVSAESVLMKQPDVVIASTAGKAGVARREIAWSALGLRAALKRHVYFISPDKLFRPGPRLADATQELCRILDQVRHTP